MPKQNLDHPSYALLVAQRRDLDDRIADRALRVPMPLLTALAAPGEHWSDVLAAWDDLPISDRYDLLKSAVGDPIRTR